MLQSGEVLAALRCVSEFCVERSSILTSNQLECSK